MGTEGTEGAEGTEEAIITVVGKEAITTAMGREATEDIAATVTATARPKRRGTDMDAHTIPHVSRRCPHMTLETLSF